jgi:hypothetical protein
MPQGFRVVSFKLETLKAQTLMERKSVDLTIGSTHEFKGGLFLGTSLYFTQYYVGATDDHDLILTFDYKKEDIIKGDDGLNSEVLVSKGVLLGARFEDEGLQDRFGHLLSPSAYDERRAMARGRSLSDSMGSKRLAVIRAMDGRIGHIHPMDYVYVIDSGAYYTSAKRVLKAYEDGNTLRTPLERAMMKTLEHAVTTAIYEGEPQQVAFAVLSSSDIYKAPNEGEFFFDASKPAPAMPLFRVDEQGMVALVPKTLDLEPAR